MQFPLQPSVPSTALCHLYGTMSPLPLSAFSMELPLCPALQPLPLCLFNGLPLYGQWWASYF